MPDTKYKFDEPESYDFRIIHAVSKRKIGKLRIKPSSILWKPVNQRQFLKVSLDEFADWIRATGSPKNQ